MKSRMLVRMVGVIGALWIFLALPDPVYAADPWYKARTYSSFTFNPAEGEVYGLEVVTLPSSDGTQVLWRLGNGKLERALLLDLLPEGKHYVVDVPPEIDGAGRWSLTMSDQEAQAKGPRGQVFRLKRVMR